MKYRLALHLYGDFFKYQLGPKLSDFLIEERRREKKKKLLSFFYDLYIFDHIVFF
jgi:hypothetical protein